MVIVWGRGDKFLSRLVLGSLRQVTDAHCPTVDGNHGWLLTLPVRAAFGAGQLPERPLRHDFCPARYVGQGSAETTR
jgi:hypothetical protein